MRALRDRLTWVNARIKKPFAALSVGFGVFFLVLAVAHGGAENIFFAGLLIASGVLDWLAPAGSRRNPPNESTIQWIRKTRRERADAQRTT
jgi:hypothetical protein